LTKTLLTKLNLKESDSYPSAQAGYAWADSLAQIVLGHNHYISVEVKYMNSRDTTVFRGFISALRLSAENIWKGEQHVKMSCFVIYL